MQEEHTLKRKRNEIAMCCSKYRPKEVPPKHVSSFGLEGFGPIITESDMPDGQVSGAYLVSDNLSNKAWK